MKRRGIKLVRTRFPAARSKRKTRRAQQRPSVLAELARRRRAKVETSESETQSTRRDAE